MPGADQTKFVFAYHEIVRAPPGEAAAADAKRCEIYYRGALSPDFYAWVFPHGDTISVGTGSAHKGFSLETRCAICEAAPGWTGPKRCGAKARRSRCSRCGAGTMVETSCSPAMPQAIVAPASGEGIYYAMLGGRLAAEAVEAFLETGDARALETARKRFMKAHGRVFWILGVMQ